MKLIAYLIIMVCLCLGTLSATIAYSPKLSMDDDSLIGLTLNAESGLLKTPTIESAETIENTDGPQPIAVKNDILTPELLATLRAAGVKRVRVKEFSIARWDVAWLMGLSCLGLGVAAFMVKVATKKEIDAELAQPSTHENSPGKSLDRVTAALTQLVSEMNASADDEARNAAIIENIGNLQRNELATLADSRTILIAQLTHTGYAQFMDRFSAMERRLNRAWSAAADGVTEEAIISLNEANDLMPGVAEAMKASTA